jgi:hypothetical protein
MGARDKILSFDFMYHNLLYNVKFSTHPNDTHRNLHFLRHFLEFLSLRI